MENVKLFGENLIHMLKKVNREWWRSIEKFRAQNLCDQSPACLKLSRYNSNSHHQRNPQKGVMGQITRNIPINESIGDLAYGIDPINEHQWFCIERQYDLLISTDKCLLKCCQSCTDRGCFFTHARDKNVETLIWHVYILIRNIIT